MINQMETAGKLKRIGSNTLVIVVAKPSDTIQVRKKYENVFKKPDGSNYEIKFSIDPKYVQNNKEAPVNKLPQNNQPVNTATSTPVAPVTGTINNNNQGCFPNMLVFGQSGYREDMKKYEWVVPQGVYKIKMECWSGGGNGVIGEIALDSTGEDFGIAKGSGGGGGAYALAVIDVKPRDLVKMNIPGGGGGKSVIIQVNDILNSLVIHNGYDGKLGNFAGNGMGGFVSDRNIRGLFSSKTLWFNGENGFLINHFNITRPSGLSRKEMWSLSFGNGGAAAKLNNGGRGSFEFGFNYPQLGLFDRPMEHGDGSINSINGGFPGGGGGAGASNRGIQGEELRAGKGAPGLVIIYY